MKTRVAFVTDKDQAYVQVFFVRGGKLIGRESFVLTGTNAEEPQEIMASFVKQYYNSAADIPPLLLLQYPIDDKDTIRDWLKQKRNGPCGDFRPETGQQEGTGADCHTKRGAGLETNEGQAICGAASDGIRH
jgi:excinuclease UvrABC nuclease subunit